MPPAVLHDAIIIALDVGRSVSERHYWEEKSFFERARECVSWIIQRKIISQSNDVLSLLLIGSDETRNAVTVSGYNNIACKFDFQVATWDMLKFVELEIKTSLNRSDWIGALIVSLEMLKVYEEFNNVQNKKIVFFSDFACPASDDLNLIVKSIKKLNIEVTIIGPDYLYLMTEGKDDGEDENGPPMKKKKEYEKSRERQEGEKLVYTFWQKLPEKIGICTFESALKQLCSYTRKARRQTPWNCLLDIGDVKINISMYKKTDPKPPKKFETRCLKLPENDSQPGTSQSSIGTLTSSDTTPTIRDKMMHYRHETGDGEKFLDVEVKPEDTVEGYRYGTTVIPFTDEDKAVMEYKSGSKAFSIIGFTSISSVPYYLLSGESSYIVTARDKDEHAEVALSAIIQAMKKMEYLGIVRRVYSDNRGVSLGILYPTIEEILCEETDEVLCREYLMFIELAFEEEIKAINFPSLENVAKKITQKQYDVIDNLIEGMDLMKADKGLRGEPCEAFDLPCLHDFKEQFFQYCVIQRGLHPEKPLPTSLPHTIEKFIKLPKSIENKCKTLVKEIKENFKIQLNKRKLDGTPRKKKVTEDANTSQVSGEVVEHFPESSIQEETNLTKFSLMKLFSKNFPTEFALDDYFERYLEDDDSNKSEVVKCFIQVIRILRRKYMTVDPAMFNSWIFQFKTFARDRIGIEPEIWTALISDNIGLISKNENPLSVVTEEEKELFHETDTTTLSCESSSNKKSDFDADEVKDLPAEQMALDSVF